jgi:hypothetical protein
VSELFRHEWQMHKTPKESSHDYWK